jgi:ribonuclease P protein component
MKQSLNKKDRLKSYSKIRELFDHGVKLRHHPINLFYLIEEDKFEDGVSMKMGVAVGTKHFKKAVQRNLLKRRIREAYRLQRMELQTYLSAQPFKLSLFFVYADHAVLDYVTISHAVKLLLDKCTTAISQKENEIRDKND